MKPGKTSRPSCGATSRRTRVQRARRAARRAGAGPRARPAGSARRRRRSAPSVRQRGRRRGRAAARSTPRRTPARRPGHQRRDRGRRGVLEHRADATRAAPPSARAARLVAELGLVRRARGRGSSASAAGACRRACSAPAPRRSRARARRPSCPRRPATGRRGSSGRCPGSATTFGSSPNVHVVWPVRSSLRVAGRERARAASGAPARAARSRSCPEATTLPCSSSTLNVIFRCAGSRARSQRVGGIRTPRWASISLGQRVQQRPLARLEALEHLRRDVRHGHEPLAQLLRQRADQRGRRAPSAARARATRSPSARSWGSA